MARSHGQIMRHIMMPLSLPGVRVAVFINLLGALRAFDIIYIMTGGGPVRATETVGYFMYRESMTQFKLGYGAAATVVLLIAVLIVSDPRHHPAYGRCEMIGRAPRWTVIVVGVIAIIWIIPIVGIVVTSIRPPAKSRSAGGGSTR